VFEVGDIKMSDKFVNKGILDKTVEARNELQEDLVRHVGNRIDVHKDQVTIGQVIGILASEFPELVITIAEENWIRGYKQGLDDAQIADVMDPEKVDDI
jgi:hypothetical protein